MFDKTVVTSGTVTPGTVAHSAADVVGGLFTFRPNEEGGFAQTGGVIEWATLADEDNEGAALTLYLFDGAPNTIAGNEAGTLAIGDLRKMCGKVTFGTANYDTINNLKFAYIGSLGIPYDADVLYGYLICSGTPTYAASKTLAVRLGIKGQ